MEQDDFPWGDDGGRSEWGTGGRADEHLDEAERGAREEYSERMWDARWRPEGNSDAYDERRRLRAELTAGDESWRNATGGELVRGYDPRASRNERVLWTPIPKRDKPLPGGASSYAVGHEMQDTVMRIIGPIAMGVFLIVTLGFLFTLGDGLLNVLRTALGLVRQVLSYWPLQLMAVGFVILFWVRRRRRRARVRSLLGRDPVRRWFR